VSAALLLAALLVELQSPSTGQATDRGAGTDARSEIPAPPPRRAVAGLEGIECLSSVVFSGTSEHPHRLRCTFVFPDRARWQLTVADEKHGDRDVRFRYGDRCYALHAGTARSEESTGDERDEILLSMELRRALLIYPDGFEWKDAGSERKADLGSVGALMARPASTTDPRPTEMRAIARSGRLVESYQAIAWREKNGRSWPSALELWRGKELVWRETVESIDVEGKVIDAFFLPADRRRAAGSAMPIENARDQELPASCGLRVEIPKGSTWADVAAGYVRLREEWGAKLLDRGLAVDRHATVELGPDGGALAWIVRLDSVPETAPPGFKTVAPRRGVVLAVRDAASITAERIGRLNASLPKDSKAGSAYARFDSRDGGSGTALIVLPYTLEKGG
jgi:hypothetical protein